MTTADNRGLAPLQYLSRAFDEFAQQQTDIVGRGLLPSSANALPNTRNGRRRYEKVACGGSSGDVINSSSSGGPTIADNAAFPTSGPSLLMRAATAALFLRPDGFLALPAAQAATPEAVVQATAAAVADSGRRPFPPPPPPLPPAAAKAAAPSIPLPSSLQEAPAAAGHRSAAGSSSSCKTKQQQGSQRRRKDAAKRAVAAAVAAAGACYDAPEFAPDLASSGYLSPGSSSSAAAAADVATIGASISGGGGAAAAAGFSATSPPPWYPATAFVRITGLRGGPANDTQQAGGGCATTVAHQWPGGWPHVPKHNAAVDWYGGGMPYLEGLNYMPQSSSSPSGGGNDCGSSCSYSTTIEGTPATPAPAPARSALLWSSSPQELCQKWDERTAAAFYTSQAALSASSRATAAAGYPHAADLVSLFQKLMLGLPLGHMAASSGRNQHHKHHRHDGAHDDYQQRQWQQQREEGMRAATLSAAVQDFQRREEDLVREMLVHWGYNETQVEAAISGSWEELSEFTAKVLKQVMRLTAAARSEYERYLQTMSAVVRSAGGRSGVRSGGRGGGGGLQPEDDGAEVAQASEAASEFVSHLWLYEDVAQALLTRLQSKLKKSACHLWCLAHLTDHTPSKEVKALLAAYTGRTPKQVVDWFTNWRARQRKPLLVAMGLMAVPGEGDSEEEEEECQGGAQQKATYVPPINPAT